MSCCGGRNSGVLNLWINLDEKNIIIKLDHNVEDYKLLNVVNQVGYKVIKVNNL